MASKTLVPPAFLPRVEGPVAPSRQIRHLGEVPISKGALKGLVRRRPQGPVVFLLHTGRRPETAFATRPPLAPAGVGGPTPVVAETRHIPATVQGLRVRCPRRFLVVARPPRNVGAVTAGTIRPAGHAHIRRF